jgi:DNA end-binding protein Ku
MRSMWKGAVSFGLVMIPVKLYTATETKDIAFRQVHREDGGRIRFRRFCTLDDTEVPYEDIAKGYELPDGEIVILTEEDLGELPLPTTKNIEVVQFCPAEQLDPILFNRSYYLEPEATGARAYSLLREALEQSGKIAIAQVALRQRESLAILRARNGVLVLETLLWPDEVREPDFSFLADSVDVRPQELRMASSLIESMTLDFDPDEYHDNYREALQEVVAAKVEGREIVQPQAVEAAEEPSSLADALRASLAAAKTGRLGAVPDQGAVADQGAGTAPAEGRAGKATAAADGARTRRPAKRATDDTDKGKTGPRKSGKAAADADTAGEKPAQRRTRKAS